MHYHYDRERFYGGEPWPACLHTPGFQSLLPDIFSDYIFHGDLPLPYYNSHCSLKGSFQPFTIAKFGCEQHTFCSNYTEVFFPHEHTSSVQGFETNGLIILPRTITFLSSRYKRKHLSSPRALHVHLCKFAPLPSTKTHTCNYLRLLKSRSHTETENIVMLKFLLYHNYIQQVPLMLEEPSPWIE